MNRKEFLRLTSMVAISKMLMSFSPLNNRKKSKIIIVGAGMSGIAAGKKLKENGFEVLILEGQNRIGGRIRSEDGLGTMLDFGASWIHGSKGNPITTLVNNYGIKTKDTDYENVRIWKYDGTVLSDLEKEELLEETNWIYKKAVKYSNKQNKDISMEDCIEAILQQEGTLSSFERQAMNWRTSTWEMNAGCDFSKLSTWYGSDKGFGGYDKLFPGGYKQLVHAMAKGLDIKTEQIVKEIKYGGSKVRVTTSKNTFEGDAVIVSVPLGVLRKGSIQFNPPLPAYKQKAINQELKMGLLNKIAFRFPKTFWPTDRHFLGHISKTRGDFPVFLNWAYYTGKPYLIGFQVGDYARSMEKLSDEEVIQRGNAVFSKLFKNSVPIEAVARSRWNSHHFSWGSYSYVPVGGGSNGGKSLAEPHDNLCFAGEATHMDYPATVHGAYLSGIREAERIIKKF